MTDEPPARHAGLARAQMVAMLPACRERLRPVVDLRLDPRLRRRMDVSDVLQDVLAEVSGRFEEYESNYRDLPFFVWVRMLTGWKLAELHRQHLGVEARDPDREVSWFERTGPGVTRHNLSEVVSAGGPSPSEQALRREQAGRLAQALEQMDDLEREVLTLRHFEQLSNQEVCHLLSLSKSASSRAYGRALRTLHHLLNSSET